ncbi:unnamed protein product [Lactuca virosa]|uniref:Uncharacterized protein n=1 Tax=Lactuca virosa TaxID=75947 RepID=A0AAU9NUU5_9ASTR|nr:unnamed protein product [Lactuca virosa]
MVGNVDIISYVSTRGRSTASHGREKYPFLQLFFPIYPRNSRILKFFTCNSADFFHFNRPISHEFLGASLNPSSDRIEIDLLRS